MARRTQGRRGDQIGRSHRPRSDGQPPSATCLRSARRLCGTASPESRHAAPDHPHPPRRLASAPARRRDAGRGAAGLARLRPRHRDAEPRPAGRHRARRGGLPRPHPRRAAGGPGLHAADDALPDRGDRPGRRGRRRVRRPGDGRQALPGRGDDEFRERRARHRPGHAGAGTDGCGRPAAVRAWRGDRSGGGHLRSRGRVHRAGAGAPARAPAGAAHRDGACHDPRRGRLHRRGGRQPRGDAHGPPPDPEPQPPARRRHAAALLLPADRQARDPPAGAARRRRFGRSAVLPRDRQRAAPAPRQGGRVLRRGRVLGPRRAGLPRPGVRGGRRARPARGLRKSARAGVLRPAAQRRADHAGARRRALAPARGARVRRPGRW